MKNMRTTLTLILAAFVMSFGAAPPATAQLAPTKPLLQGERADGTRVLMLNDDGGLALRGLPGGGIPHQGTGSLLLWHPGKAAFRAGHVEGNQWTDASIGIASLAVGLNTVASGEKSVAFGQNATASGELSFAMGSSVQATGIHSNAIGNSTQATGNMATAIGGSVLASGDLSFALGSWADTGQRRGSFVFGDGSAGAGSFVRNTADNQFMVRASGGTIFYSNSGLTAGVSLASGAGAWASVSDRGRKENFRQLDGEQVLAEIRGLSIPEWNYKSQDASVRRVGPMAQDFRAAFGLGEDDTTITTSDISGINMLAIQALEARTRDLEALRGELNAAREELALLRSELRELVAAQAATAPVQLTSNER